MTPINKLIHVGVAVSAGLFGLVLMLDAEIERTPSRESLAVAAPVPADVSSRPDVTSPGRSLPSPRRLSSGETDKAVIAPVPAEPVEPSTAAGIWELSDETLPAGDEPAIVTADVDEAAISQRVVPVAAAELPAASIDASLSSPDAPAGKSRVSLPIQPEATSGRARVSRPAAAEPQEQIAAGRARISLPLAQPSAGKARIRLPLEKPVAEVEPAVDLAVARNDVPPAKEQPPTVFESEREKLSPSDEDSAVAVIEDFDDAQRFASAALQQVPPAPDADEEPMSAEPGDDNDTLEFAGFKPIGELGVDINLVKGEDPPDLAAPEFEEEGEVVVSTEWVNQTLTAPLYPFYHQPLYFEDPNAERCGKTHCCPLQAAASAAHFYLTIPALPYLLCTLPPKEPVESLGDCAWGCKFDCHEAYCPPFSWKGTAAQSAAVVGLIFLIP